MEVVLLSYKPKGGKIKGLAEGPSPVGLSQSKGELGAGGSHNCRPSVRVASFSLESLLFGLDLIQLLQKSGGLWTELGGSEAGGHHDNVQQPSHWQCQHHPPNHQAA